MRLLSVSSSRADLSIMGPVWDAALAAGHQLDLVLTGQHATADLVPAEAYGGARRYRGGADPRGGSAAEAAQAMAAIGAFTAQVIAETAPDVMLVIGDRIDMAPAALAAVPFNLPLAHLHGGERSYGAVDDRLRHALSKLAHIHLAASADAVETLAAMGEERWRISHTGAPGLDTLRQRGTLDASTFAEAVGLPSLVGLRLVTIHPETNGGDSMALVEAILGALDETPGPVLLTGANGDPGGAEINARLIAWAESRPETVYRETLGMALYPSALRLASVMIGNSSSGLIEAPFAGLAVIDVGHRQDGRLHGRNVVRCEADRQHLALRLITHRRSDPNDLRFVDDLYGDGMAGPRIVSAIADRLKSPDLLTKRLPF